MTDRLDIMEIDTDSRYWRQQFLSLPFRLYRHVPQWVPPLAPDAALMLDRERHPFFRHSDAIFLLARRNDETIGRLAVLDNANYNAYNHERSAFFYLFECIDERAVALALFEHGFAWARRRGLEQMKGPRGLSALDGIGLLVEGFEHRPALGIPYNPAYYPALVEAAGFERLDDSLSGYLSTATKFPEKIHQVSELVQKRRGLRVVRFQTRRELLQLVPQLGDLYNNALGGTSGGVPLTADEMQAIANQILHYADPRLVKIVMKEDEAVGFLLAYPDVSAAVQRTGGHLWPVGWIDLLRELKRSKWVNINGAGIVAKYRGLGGMAILFSEMQKSLVEGGFEHADLVQISVSNDNMQRELRDLGVDFYKMHRQYARSL